MFRKAVMDDLDEIEKIYDETHSKIESGEIFVAWDRSVYPTRKTGEDSILRGDMFVGEKDDQVLACAIINGKQGEKYKDVKWTYDAPKDEVMVLNTLVVSPRAGGKGIGTKFIKFYKNYALESGCRYLRLDTNENNIYVRKLYEKLGYKEAFTLSSEFYVPGRINLAFSEELIYFEKKL